MAFFVFLSAGCDQASDQQNIGKEQCTPLDYRNGVFYFPCTGARFGNSLSNFKSKNSDFSVTAITGNGTRGYGKDIGYFVSTESMR